MKSIGFIGALEMQVYQYAQSNPEGFTLDLRTGEAVTSGYSVAYYATQNSFGERGLKRAVIHSINTSTRTVGGWYNTENGHYYYDSVRIFSDKEEAIAFGLKNKQIAIFDLNKMQEIRL